MATPSSILAWRVPWAEEPGGLRSSGSQRGGHDRASEHTSNHRSARQCKMRGRPGLCQTCQAVQNEGAARSASELMDEFDAGYTDTLFLDYCA